MIAFLEGLGICLAIAAIAGLLLGLCTAASHDNPPRPKPDDPPRFVDTAQHAAFVRGDLIDFEPNEGEL